MHAQEGNVENGATGQRWEQREGQAADGDSCWQVKQEEVLSDDLRRLFQAADVTGDRHEADLPAVGAGAGAKAVSV